MRVVLALHESLVAGKLLAVFRVIKVFPLLLVPVALVDLVAVRLCGMCGWVGAEDDGLAVLVGPGRHMDFLAPAAPNLPVRRPRMVALLELGVMRAPFVLANAGVFLAPGDVDTAARPGLARLTPAARRRAAAFTRRASASRPGLPRRGLRRLRQ